MTAPQRLEAVCQLTMGQAPDGDSYNTDGDGLPLIAGAGDFGEVHPAAKKFTTAPGKICCPGDIVLGIRASIGEKVIADREYCLGRGVAGLRARTGLDSRYLWHWLTHVDPILAAKAKGATFKQVNREDISELAISLPPLPYQRRIAEVLDRVETLRTKRRTALTQLDTLVQAIFLDVFGDPVTNPKGWPKQHLGDLLVAIRNGANAEQRTEPNGWAITRIETISDGTINPSRVRWIEPDDSLLEDFQLEPGDILFSHINSVEHIAKTALYSGQPSMLIHGINLLRLRSRRSFVEPVWLLFLLRHPAVRTHFRTRCKRAVNQASLNQPDIKSLETYLPPLSLQQEFVRRIANVENLRLTHRASLAKLDALFASLQNRAFRGEL